MDHGLFKVYRLTGGIVDVVVVSWRRPDGTWGTSVLQQIPGWGFRLSELTPVTSEDCIPRVLTSFQKWAGGQIHEVNLLNITHLLGTEPHIDSGWVRLKDHHFFRMLQVG